MNIIITMAGLGSRFTKEGYNCPKYMIEAKGKTLFEWSMLSLVDYNSHVNKYVFVVRKENNSKQFIIDEMKKYNITNVEVVEIDYLTDGQATTAKLGIELCDENDSILIYNIDTYIEPYNLRYKDLVGDGHIPCFNAEGNHWSFVKEVDGKVVDVVEKNRISNNCSLGAYYFKTAKLFNEIYDKYYTRKSSGEKYIAPMYKHMLDEGYVVTYSIIDINVVHVLGTPEELKAFINV
ncbi:MAG: glycosyltransferase family 2 protein [Acholeplasmatales bacterium]|nr:glycosyltransferase family 2 protein [Acholeplasmatales bacterium]